MEEDIKKLLEENLALTREVREMTLKTKNYIKWLRIMDGVKWLLILIPLIAAYIFLPSLLSSLSGGYGELLPGLMR